MTVFVEHIFVIAGVVFAAALAYRHEDRVVEPFCHLGGDPTFFKGAYEVIIGQNQLQLAPVSEEFEFIFSLGDLFSPPFNLGFVALEFFLLRALERFCRFLVLFLDRL